MKTTAKICFFGLLLIFTGCVTLYKPNAIHSPLLHEKGNLNTSAILSFSGSGLANLQAAYALSDHVGIMADGMYHFRSSNNTESVDEKLNMLFGEAGVGYFRRFGNTMLFQCYGGGGYGRTSDVIDYPDQPDPEAKASYYTVFFQPGVAVISDRFEVAFDLKANYVQMFDISAYLYDQFEWWNTDSKFHPDTTLNFMNLEPTITLKAGGKKLKGFLQTGITMPTVNRKSYFGVSTSSLFVVPLIKFSVGVSYRF